MNRLNYDGGLIEELFASDNANELLYWYYKGLEDRVIIINEDIDSNIVEHAILPLLAMEHENPSRPIRIYINTKGGSVYDGLVLCNVIDNLKCPTEIISLGCAFSMGLLILMAGKNNPNVTRKAYKFSFGLLHEGSVEVGGSVNAVRQVQKFQQKLNEDMKQYIIDHTNLTEEEYEKIRYDEHYMTAQEMLEMGVIDEII